MGLKITIELPELEQVLGELAKLTYKDVAHIIAFFQGKAQEAQKASETAPTPGITEGQ